MRRFVDLHTHSYASDGSYPPEDLIAQADRAGLAAIALTDHDTTSGLAAAAAAARAYPELTFVPGVEMSAATPRGTMHILGLWIDADAPAMRALIERSIQARYDRNPRIIDKLRAMGIEISLEEVERLVTGIGATERPIVTRIHIARVLSERGLAGSIDDAFAKFVAVGAPAYVEKDRIPPREVIGAIADSGGLSILAHPVQLACDNYAQLERVLRELQAAGLDGIEAYHGSHTNEQVRAYRDLAMRLDLSITGGSDFHGLAKPEVSLGHPRVPAAGITGRAAERLGPR